MNNIVGKGCEIQVVLCMPEIIKMEKSMQNRGLSRDESCVDHLICLSVPTK